MSEWESFDDDTRTVGDPGNTDNEADPHEEAIVDIDVTYDATIDSDFDMGPQYPQGVVHGRLLDEAAPSEDKPEETALEGVNHPAALTWQPKWLRTKFFALFAGLFLVMTLGIPALLWYDNRKEGIMEAQEKYVYLWRFGPTAFLTIVTAFWERVELQSKRYFPWIAMKASDQLLTRDIYTLDYMSMSPPVALIRSMRRRHHLVYLTVMISIILKAQIALTSGLFSLSDVIASNEVKVKVLDYLQSHYDPPEGHEDLEQPTIAYYITQAIHDHGMAYPFGVNKTVAYQTFEMKDDIHGHIRGTTDAPLKVVVDGFFSDIECLKSENQSISLIDSMDFPGSDLRSFRANVSLYFDQCDEVIQIPIIAEFPYDDQNWRLLEMKGTADLWTTQCSAPPQKQRQFVLFAAFAKPSISNASSLEFLSTTAGIICASVSWISKVEVTDDGFEPRITAPPEQTRLIVEVDVWNLIIRGSPHDINANFLRQYISPSSVNWSSENVTDWMELFDNNILLQATETLFQRSSSLVPHYVLRERKEIEMTGHLMLRSRRLRVSRRLAMSLTALLGTTASTAAFILFFYCRGQRIGYWPRDPASLLGTIIFLREHRIHRPLILDLSVKSKTGIWGGSASTPLILRAWARALFTIWVLIITFWLVLMQKRSDIENGLATVDGEANGYEHLLWTAFPALIILSVPLYAISCGITYRSLSILWLSSIGNCIGRNLDQSLLDMLGIRAIYHSVRLRIYTVTLSQLLAVVCGLLTTLTSGLIGTQEFTPKPRNTQFQQHSFFGSPPLGQEAISSTRQALQSFLLIRKDYNFTYPKNTYQDLIFPDLGVKEDPNLSAIVSANMTIRAAQLQFNCTKLSADQFKVSLSKTRPGFSTRIVRFYLPTTCPNGTVIHRKAESIFELDDHWADDLYFSTDFPSTDNSKGVNDECQLAVKESHADFATTRFQTYLWGAYSAHKKEVSFISAWTCSYSWFEMSTEVSLVVADDLWELDPTNPPRPEQSITKLWEPAFNIPRAIYPSYDGDPAAISIVFPDVYRKNSSSNLLYGQPAILVAPFGDFRLEDFGNPTQEQAIIQKLSQNLGLITAQLSNVESRIYVNESSATNGHPILPRVNATVNYKSQYRLYQSSMITYVLVVIISTAVLFNIWSLFSAMMRRLGKLQHSPLLDMNAKGLAPDGFGSIAAIADLLRDSNVWGYLPPTAESHSADDLHEILANLHFRMGWFQSTREPPGRYFTIGVVGDEEFEFLGSKEDMKDEEVLGSPGLAADEGGSMDGAGSIPGSEANSMIAEDGPEEGLSLASGNERMSSVDLTDEEARAVGERPSSGNGHRD